MRRATWADQLAEPDLRAALTIGAGPPFVAEICVFVAVPLLVVALRLNQGKQTPVLALVAAIATLLVGLWLSGHVRTRIVASHWVATIGARPRTGMILGIAGDRLVIWPWPSRRRVSRTRIADLPLADVTLHARSAFLGALVIELPDGNTVLVHHNLGPHEQEARALLLAEVAAAATHRARTTRAEH